jgi:predicted enzyme related to lactoylglutathione lyase
MNPAAFLGQMGVTLRASPVVHLELHTADLAGACALYRELCGWSSDRVDTAAGAYRTLDPGDRLSGGVVECETRHPLWLPYVEVADAARAAARAQALGASVLLEPREGPAGWRSIVATPAGGELAFWQPKR